MVARGGMIWGGRFKAGNREQGTESREQRAGNREQGIGNRKNKGKSKGEDKNQGKSKGEDKNQGKSKGEDKNQGKSKGEDKNEGLAARRAALAYSGAAAVPRFRLNVKSPYKSFSFCWMAARYWDTGRVSRLDFAWKLLNRHGLSWFTAVQRVFGAASLQGSEFRISGVTPRSVSVGVGPGMAPWCAEGFGPLLRARDPQRSPLVVMCRQVLSIALPPPPALLWTQSPHGKGVAESGSA